LLATLGIFADEREKSISSEDEGWQEAKKFSGGLVFVQNPFVTDLKKTDFHSA